MTVTAQQPQLPTIDLTVEVIGLKVAEFSGKMDEYAALRRSLQEGLPVLAVKQKILSHEYEEMIRDAHSEHGHLDLIIRQGKPIGLTAENILQTQPIPTTAATLYAWG